MLDGTVDGYDAYEQAVAAHPPTPLDEAARRGPGHALQLRHHRSAQGREGAPSRRAAGRRRRRGQLDRPPALRGHRGRACTSPPPPCTTPPRCGSAGRPTASAAPWSSWSTSTPSSTSPSSSATAAPSARSCRRCSSACSSCPTRYGSRYDLSSLATVVHAAAPCPAEVKAQMIAWWGPIVHEYYAGTEGNGFVYCNSEDWLAHRGTVGRAISGTIHILDDDGEEVPTGEARHRLLRRRRGLQLPQGRGQDPQRPGPEGPGVVDPRATWATSTPRGTSTSPTARRT